MTKTVEERALFAALEGDVAEVTRVVGQLNRRENVALLEATDLLYETLLKSAIPQSTDQEDGR